MSRHASDRQQDPAVAEEREQQRQEEAEDEQADDVGTGRDGAAPPLDGADGAGTLRPVTAKRRVC